MSNEQIRQALVRIEHAQNKHVKVIRDYIDTLDQYIDYIRLVNWQKADYIENRLTIALTK